MGGESKRRVWWMVLLLVAATYYPQTCVRAADSPDQRCMFIFGDSLSDPGNNNLLPTPAKANYFPYGIDFPGGVATGRFCNKFNSVDYIANFIGIPLIPPFANTSGSDILRGVNYASAAAGILPDTGFQLGLHDNLPSQIIKHKVIHDAIGVKLGGVEAAEKYLHKCLFHLNIGVVDYYTNYLKPLFNLTRFTDTLIAQYALQIKALYDLGARKFALIGIGRIGCVPYIRSTNNGECAQVLNEAGSLFSEKLKSLVDQFNSEYSGEASFVFVNSTAISTQNPAFLALKNQKDSCCKTTSGLLCTRNETPCENRDEHVYWDGVHTTDAAHKIYALSQYNASNTNFANPMDINHLLSLSLSPSPAA